MVQGITDQDKRRKESPPSSVFAPPYPFRHKNYLKALHSIEAGLKQDNALILQGAERTGKSTLISEIKHSYEQQGIEVISFTAAVNTPRQLYSLLAEALDVHKLKKDLVDALIRTQETGNYCLVILDEAAVNSSAAVSEALRKLCDPRSKTAGAIKVIVVCADYLVIQTKTTYDTDFHDWVKNIVPMHSILPEELEGLTHYLASLKNSPSPHFEIGTDLELLERSNGKIDSLIALINPLIDESIISKSRFKPVDEGVHPLDSNRSKYYFLAVASVLVLLIGLGMHSIIVPSVEETQEAPIDENLAVFKQEYDAGEASINPPVLDAKKEKNTEEKKTTLREMLTAVTKPKTPDPTLVKVKNHEPLLSVDKIEPMIDAWVKTQKERNSTDYFSHYQKGFSTGKTSNKAWRNKTVSSFKNEQLLKLQRGNLDIEVINEQQAKVEFWLDQMSSKGSQSRIQKRLILSNKSKQWKIQNELNLQVVKKR